MSAITHNLIQGSDAWQAFRLQHHGASEAAAMLGLSSHTTRNELLHVKKTFTPREFSDWVQRNVLDYGHEVEAMARPLAEAVIGTELYPVTCSMGKLSASLDGLTMAEDVAFEHKQLNQALADSVAGGVLPDEYQPQCQQIMLITGAERVLFMVSDGTLDNMVYMWVLPDQAWMARIVAGWAQFEKDLAAYVPQEYAPKPVATPIMALPALAIYIKGEVTTSNLPEFKEQAERFIASIKTELVTDEDFADAEAMVKACGEAEARLILARDQALAQTVDIDVLMRTINHLGEQFRVKRLELDKLVTAKKQSIKEAMVSKAMLEYRAHVDALEAEIAPIRMIGGAPDFAGAAKGKRTPGTMQNAIDTEMAHAKILADQAAKGLRGRLWWYREVAHGDHPEVQFLFADLQNLIQKPDEDFKLAVKARIDEYRATRALAQEAMKANNLARAEAETEVAFATEMTTPRLVPGAVPTLRLGQIGERLGFNLSAEFLASLGFAATKSKGSCLYHDADWPMICAALCRHISAVQSRKAA